MYSWGQCEYGQLGLGGIPDVEVPCPRLVSDVSLDLGVSIQDVKAGNSHSVILTSDGKLYSCGSNEYGQVCCTIYFKIKFIVIIYNNIY